MKDITMSREELQEALIEAAMSGMRSYAQITSQVLKALYVNNNKEEAYLGLIRLFHGRELEEICRYLNIETPTTLN